MNRQGNKGRFFRALSAIIVLGCIAGVVYSLGQLKPAKPIQGALVLKYKNFETKNPAIDFSFEYPEMGWTPVETAGRIEKYDQVYLRGPVDKKTKFTTVLNTTLRPLEAGKTAADLLETYLKTDSNLNKFKVLHKETREVGGEKAFLATCTYEQVPLHRIDVPPVPLKKQMVFLVKGERSYEFTLVTIASQNDAYALVLKHVLETFQFKK